MHVEHSSPFSIMSERLLLCARGKLVVDRKRALMECNPSPLTP